jgi:hypothetical protein
MNEHKQQSQAPKGFSGRTDRSSGDSDHETHVGALVFLILVTFLVVSSALSMAQPHEPHTQENTPKVDAVAKNKTNTPAQSGVDIPQALRVFPQGLPAPHAAELLSVSNAENGSMAQHIVRLETDQPLSKLFDQYNQWAQNSGFQVTDSSQNGSNAAIALARPDSQFFITMVDLRDSRRVEFNQVQK